MGWLRGVLGLFAFGMSTKIDNEIVSEVRRLGALLAQPDAKAPSLAAAIGKIAHDYAGANMVVKPKAKVFREASIGRPATSQVPTNLRLTLAKPMVLSAFVEAF